MHRDGFLRFCDDPEIACCRAEAELGQLRTENARLTKERDEAQRRERAAVECQNVLVGLIAERLSAGSFEKLCELADELEVFVTDWRGPQEAGNQKGADL